LTVAAAHGHASPDGVALRLETLLEMAQILRRQWTSRM
jgi:hypothetical protein